MMPVAEEDNVQTGNPEDTALVFLLSCRASKHSRGHPYIVGITVYEARNKPAKANKAGNRNQQGRSMCFFSTTS